MLYDSQCLSIQGCATSRSAKQRPIRRSSTAQRVFRRGSPGTSRKQPRHGRGQIALSVVGKAREWEMVLEPSRVDPLTCRLPCTASQCTPTRAAHLTNFSTLLILTLQHYVEQIFLYKKLGNNNIDSYKTFSYLSLSIGFITQLLQVLKPQGTKLGL